MQKYLILFLSLISLSSLAQGTAGVLSTALSALDDKERFCEDAFNKSMEDLLKNDSNNLLTKSFNLASLKLAYRQLSEGQEKQTLEKYIKKKIKELDLADKSEFRQRVKELYEKNGESKDLSEITEIIEGLDDKNYYPRANRLSNKEGSVFMLALSMYDECEVQSLCIDKNDAAVTWFMGELHERAMENNIGSEKSNLMHLSVKVAHTAGVFNDTIPHEPAELSEKISDLEHDVKTTIHNHKLAFLEEFGFCKSIIEDSKCLQKAVTEGYDVGLSSVLRTLRKQNATDVKDEELKIKFADQIVLNLQNSLTVKRPPPPEPKIEEAQLEPAFGGITVGMANDQPEKLCGGKKFSRELESIHAFGFDLSRLKYLQGGKSNTRYHKVRKFMDTFKDGISGPGIKVMAFMKTFILNYKHGRTSVCCNDAVDWRKNYGVNLSMYGGVEAKIGYNLGFLNYNLAGVGFLAGLGVSVGVGYTTPPVGCVERDQCAQGKISPAVYGGGYVEAVDGWVGGELKIVWRPYIIGNLCFTGSTSDKFAKLIGAYKVGSIMLQGTLQVGWLTTYNYYKPIYDNHEDHSYDFDVLP